MNASDAPLDPQQLVDEYFLRDFSDQEMEALNAALAGDPALKAQFITNMHEDLDLFETYQHAEDEPVLREQTIVPLPRERMRVVERKQVRVVQFGWMHKIAAALVFFLGVSLVYWMVKPPASTLSHSVATVESVETLELVETGEPVEPVRAVELVARVTDLFALEGDRVSAANSNESRSLSIGDRLRVGDDISVPTGGRLAFEYLSEATTVSFEADSSFRIMDADGAKVLELRDGSLEAKVARQKPGKPFRILTDDAEIVVVGTRFELSNEGETRLSVISGEVQMNDLYDDGSVSVPAGYFVESDRGRFSPLIAFDSHDLQSVSCRTLPKAPFKDVVDNYIIVDPERNLKGRLDFRIPPFEGRICRATLRLRVVPYAKDRGGNGTVRVKRAAGRNALNSTRAFNAAAEMSRHQGRVDAGMDLVFDLDPSHLVVGHNHLVLAMDKGGNDFWFAGQRSLYRPQLRLTIIE